MVEINNVIVQAKKQLYKPSSNHVERDFQRLNLHLYHLV